MILKNVIKFVKFISLKIFKEFIFYNKWNILILIVKTFFMFILFFIFYFFILDHLDFRNYLTRYSSIIFHPLTTTPEEAKQKELLELYSKYMIVYKKYGFENARDPNLDRVLGPVRRDIQLWARKFVLRIIGLRSKGFRLLTFDQLCWKVLIRQIFWLCILRDFLIYFLIYFRLHILLLYVSFFFRKYRGRNIVKKFNHNTIRVILCIIVCIFLFNIGRYWGTGPVDISFLRL